MSDIGTVGAGAQALTALNELVIALNAIAAVVKNLPIPVVSPPTTSTSLGQAGSFAYDSDFLYVCVATNVWKRTPLSAW